MNAPSQAVETGLGVGTYLLGSLYLAASAVEGLSPFWTEIFGWIERIGLPAMLVAGICWAAVRVSRWLAVHAIQPLVGKGVETMGKVQEGIQELRDASRAQGVVLERVTERMSRIAEGETEDAERDREAHRETMASLDSLRHAIDTLTNTARGNTPEPRGDR